MAQVEKVEDDMSMDEILASIRRIISEESKAEEKTFSYNKEQEKPALSPEPSFEKSVQEPEPVPQEKEEIPPAPFIASVKETLYGFPREGRGEFSPLPPAFGQTPSMAPPPPPASAPVAPTQKETATTSPASGPPLPSFGSEQNSQLQAFMYDLIRPLLKDWVDAYLPSLIEKAVAAEVSKMFQKLREP